MFDTYFKDFEKNLVNKTTKKKTAKTASKKKTTKKVSKKTSAAKVTLDLKIIKEKLQKIIPAYLKIEAVKPIDSNGYTSDGADLIAYKEYCTDIIEIMNGHVPYELIYGTFYIEPYLDKKNLVDVIKRVSAVKKLNYFAAGEAVENPIVIPSFIIAYDSEFSFSELKEEVIDYYIENNIEHSSEFDIMAILNKGVVVKNWREKRSYIALETKEDTSQSLFILMSDYLDIDRGPIDFRKYITKDAVYDEY